MTEIHRDCVECGESFVLKPGKPGYANVCSGCTERALEEEVKAEVEKFGYLETRRSHPRSRKKTFMLPRS
jgi:hypothetical protein